jgi:hypothetical protein
MYIVGVETTSGEVRRVGGMGMQVIGQHVIGTLLTCREVKTWQRTETTDFGAQEIDYRIGRSVGTRVDWLTQTAGQ